MKVGAIQNNPLGSRRTKVRPGKQYDGSLLQTYKLSLGKQFFNIAWLRRFFVPPSCAKLSPEGDGAQCDIPIRISGNSLPFQGGPRQRRDRSVRSFRMISGKK